MKSSATTVAEYLRELPDDRRRIVRKLRTEIRRQLSQGFTETMGYGMIAYVVPHKRYPAGYHCDPKLPLPFMNLASQKQYVALYHMGLYDTALQDWFVARYRDTVGQKPDMGKCCIRFRRPELIPYALVGELSGQVTVDGFIAQYEQSRSS